MFDQSAVMQVRCSVGLQRYRRLERRTRPGDLATIRLDLAGVGMVYLWLVWTCDISFSRVPVSFVSRRGGEHV
jgi:hypothetical protein